MNLRMLIWTLLLAGACTVPQPMAAQSADNPAAVRNKRISHIDFYHVSVGAGFAMYRNMAVGPQISFGVGSFRNILNADVGIRYIFMGPFPHKDAERVSVQQLPVFISLNVNAIRWRTGCIYIGGEMAYTPAVMATHYIPSTGKTLPDLNAGKSHFTPAAKLGFRQGDIDLALFYEYDMKPSFDQKYIFETIGYDYDALKYSIFERMRFGIRFLYHFNF